MLEQEGLVVHMIVHFHRLLRGGGKRQEQHKGEQEVAHGNLGWKNGAAIGAVNKC
jgi:hypothetical protein